MIKFSEKALSLLADMIIGDAPHFPYRSSSAINKFCTACDLEDIHKGESRGRWMVNVLERLSTEHSSHPDLPSDQLLHVLSELMNIEYYHTSPHSAKVVDFNLALADLNKVLCKYGVSAYTDQTKNCFFRNDGTGATSVDARSKTRPLTHTEIEQRKLISLFLDSASEDDFTEKVLVPYFQRLGYVRVQTAGHRDKALEFGKDMWMKFQIPTGHWLYFCVQVKREKIDSAGKSTDNVTEVLNQARMALDHPIFDQDVNRNVLLDHLYVISSGEITKQARHFLVGKLDSSQRRHIIFMDRSEFLDHSAKFIADVMLATSTGNADIGF